MFPVEHPTKWKIKNCYIRNRLCLAIYYIQLNYILRFFTFEPAESVIRIQQTAYQWTWMVLNSELIEALIMSSLIVGSLRSLWI